MMSTRIPPARLSEQSDKPAGGLRRSVETIGRTSYQYQGLLFLASDGNNQSRADSQLLTKRLGNRGSSGAHQNPVISGVLGPAERAVTAAKLYVLVTNFVKAFCGAGEERKVPFDREDACSEFSKYRGLVPGTGSDFEDARLGSHTEQFRHLRDHVRLGDRLTDLDREGTIVIGAIGKRRWNVAMPRHAAHGFQDALVANIPRDELGSHHFVALGLPLVRCAHFSWIVSGEQ